MSLPASLPDLPPYPGDGQWTQRTHDEFATISKHYSRCYRILNSPKPEARNLRLMVDRSQKHLIPITLTGLDFEMEYHPWVTEIAVLLIKIAFDMENAAQILETGVETEISYPAILRESSSTIRECSIGTLAHLCFPSSLSADRERTDEEYASAQLTTASIGNENKNRVVEGNADRGIGRRAREDRRNKAIAEGRKPQRRFTIAACEDDDDLEKIEVLLQRQKHTSTLVIPSSMASVPCATLGISDLLRDLNDIQGTAYTLDDPILVAQLKACIDHNYDFGVAYARLRPTWQWTDRSEAQRDLEKCELRDWKLRQEATNAQDQIKNPRVPPRRVWDLYSNRVIPSWVPKQSMAAVSHAWMSPECRQCVDSPINSYEWPVPIPDDITLERVRIELLNLRLIYVWLDVLCLRQHGSQENEQLRIKEWAIDVPTIGNVYHENQFIVHYYSGLGRPFRIGDLDSSRHWINRAWTLQENSANSIIAGVAPDSPITFDFDEENRRFRDPVVGRFYEAIGTMASYSQDPDSLFPLLKDMRHRAAVSELDKIAGLAYLLRSMVLPVYIPDQPPEDAWRRLVETMLGKFRGDLLFRIPVPGDGRHIWYPTWHQVKQMVLPKSELISEEVQYDQQHDVYSHRGYRFNHCRVEGLVEPGDRQEGRRGRVTILAKNGIKFVFECLAYHTQPIPEDHYTLIGGQGCEYWVVGRVNDSGRIEKISVIRMCLGGDEEVVAQNFRTLRHLSIGKVVSEWA